MQKGILVVDGSGNVISKDVYGGDVSDATMQKYVDQAKANNPKDTVTLIDTDNDPEFIDSVPMVTLDPALPVNALPDPAFSKLVTLDDKVAYIAKKLGLS